MNRATTCVRAATAAILFSFASAIPSLAQESPAAETGKTETAPGTTVQIDPGNGVTFSSSDGNYSLNIGFFGQFRAQYLDRDEFRRADLNPSLPYRVENIGVQEPSFQTRRLRLH